MTADHPQVRAALEAEEQIARDLHNELAVAIRGLELDSRLNADHADLLQSQLAKVSAQLNDLADVRATYSNLLAEVKTRENLLQRAEQNLAEARADQASARASSLISRIDSPETGSSPVGPGRGLITLAGLGAGLLVGWAVLLLSLPGAAVRAAETTPAGGRLRAIHYPPGGLSLEEKPQLASGNGSAK